MSKYRLFKHVEREIARRLNGRRTGHMGGADVQTDWLCVEVKTRKTLPKWMKDALAQAQGNAGPEQLPILVVHEQGQRYDDDWVLITSKNFVEWFGGQSPSPVAEMADRALTGDADAKAWLQVCAPDWTEE